jgi:hypothetical protein
MPWTLPAIHMTKGIIFMTDPLADQYAEAVFIKCPGNITATTTDFSIKHFITHFSMEALFRRILEHLTQIGVISEEQCI